MTKHRLHRSLRHNALGLRQRRAAAPIEYLLRDDFLTDEAAPLASPRTAEPGPGTWTVRDINNHLSISDGKLVFDGNADLYLNPRLQGPQMSRTPGRAMGAALVRASGQYAILGSQAIGDAAFAGVKMNGLNLLMHDTHSAGSIGPVVGQLSGDPLWLILRSAGQFYVQGTTLLYVGTSSTAPLDPAFASHNVVGTIDWLRVCDLPAPWDTDYGIATQRLAGARSAGDSYSHEADCLIEAVVTTLPADGQIEMRFRVEDESNYWQWTVDAAGNLDLDEVVDGAVTQWGNAAGAVTDGDRILAVVVGSTIHIYETNTLAHEAVTRRITYARATNFATATAGKLHSLGTGGAVSDIVAWPRTLSGSAAAALEAAA